MPVSIFLSYRRHASDEATALYRALVPRFGLRNVFKDVESILGGTDYVAALARALASCDVFVAMIDPHWAVDVTGRNRLSDPDDWVRREVEAALARHIPLVPVVLDGAPSPHRDVLPPTMEQLLRIQAVPLRRGAWVRDVEILAALIERVAMWKVGAGTVSLVQAGTPLTRQRKGPSPLIRPGSRVRIGLWAGTIKPHETGLPFEIAAAAGQTGTVLRIDGRIVLVRWDVQRWSKRFLGFFRGSTVVLDSFESTVHADYLEPMV